MTLNAATKTQKKLQESSAESNVSQFLFKCNKL